MRTYAYLRASTAEQDATRALVELEEFATQHGLTIAAPFIENVSGASLQRPELFRLLTVAQPGDILLVEQIDRLSRLNADDWEKLRSTIDPRRHQRHDFHRAGGKRRRGEKRFSL